MILDGSISMEGAYRQHTIHACPACTSPDRVVGECDEEVRLFGMLIQDWIDSGCPQHKPPMRVDGTPGAAWTPGVGWEPFA